MNTCSKTEANKHNQVLSPAITETMTYNTLCALIKMIDLKNIYYFKFSYSILLQSVCF